MWKGVNVNALRCHAIFGEIMGMGGEVVADVFVVLTVLQIYTNKTHEFFLGPDFFVKI